jgi:hypothetical protein
MSDPTAVKIATPATDPKKSKEKLENGTTKPASDEKKDEKKDEDLVRDPPRRTRQPY